jgi:CelD/BcsL family acetyltransferase involved in cellulose biosynthesis
LSASGHETDALTTRLITDPLEFAALKDRWDAAVERSVDPNVFLTWEWLNTWWEHFGASRELHVVVIARGGELVLLAPMVRSRLGQFPASIRVLRSMSHDAGDYAGVVLAHDDTDAVDLFARHLVMQVTQDRNVVVMPRLAADSRFLALFLPRIRAHAVLHVSEDVLGGSCPYTDVRDGFDLQRTAKKHKVFQRLRRLHDAEPDVCFRYHSGDDLEQGLQWLQWVHERRWSDRPEELQGLFASSEHQAFLLDAVRELDRRGWVRLISLSVDERPVAVDLCFEYAARLSMFKGAIDPAYGRFSPGQLVTHRTFEDGIARGDIIFDFMRGDHDYKQRWANHERHLVTLTLTRSGAFRGLDRIRLRAASAIERRRSRAGENET